jgi:hypothetical protein
MLLKILDIIRFGFAIIVAFIVMAAFFLLVKKDLKVKGN